MNDLISPNLNPYVRVVKDSFPREMDCAALPMCVCVCVCSDCDIQLYQNMNLKAPSMLTNKVASGLGKVGKEIWMGGMAHHVVYLLTYVSIFD